MQRAGTQRPYLLLGGIVGAVVLVLAEAKAFLAAQQCIEDFADMPPIAAPDQPAMARPLARIRATGTVAMEFGRQNQPRPTWRDRRG